MVSQPRIIRRTVPQLHVSRSKRSSILRNMLTRNKHYRKINKSSATVEDPSILKQHLTKPPVKRIDLHFPLGMEVTARNLKGVTIKDALDAIHKAYKKRVCIISLSLPCQSYM